MSQNIERAQKILQWFESLGVTDICICPGGRNAPFVHALENSSAFKVVSAFDERAAGFFTFGRAYAQQAPAVVITTSGTAAAELLPSVIESYYSGAPLIVVTADRPQQLRGSGSPQVIDQYRLFGNYVEDCIDIDWDCDWQEPLWTQKKPLHINISFEEPLIDSDLKIRASPSRLPRPQRNPLDTDRLLKASSLLIEPNAVPLLILGPLHSQEFESAQKIATAWPGLVYAEAASGLREVLFKNQLQAGEKFLSQLLRSKKISGVLRLGGVPTLKLWRELEATTTPVVSLSSRPFAGMARGELIHADWTTITEVLFKIETDQSVLQEILATDKNLVELQKKLLKKYSKSEPALVRSLSQNISFQDKIYIGNSLPIREWDAFASYQHGHHLLVNRGANGIDGQIASALGMCKSTDSLSLVVGDLTALYDATGLWFKSQVKELRVFVINNNGGRIFERLFKKPSFYNTHTVDFSGWAKMWGMEHVPLSVIDQNLKAPAIYEILPDQEQTHAFWKDYDQLFS